MDEIFSFTRDNKLLNLYQDKLEENKNMKILNLFSYLFSRQLNLVEKENREISLHSAASSVSSSSNLANNYNNYSSYYLEKINISQYIHDWLYESAEMARKFVSHEIVDLWMLENTLVVFDDKNILSPEDSHIWYNLILELFERFPMQKIVLDNGNLQESYTSEILNKIQVSDKLRQILTNSDVRHNQYIQHSELGIAAMKTVGNSRKSLLHQVQLLLYLSEHLNDHSNSSSSGIGSGISSSSCSSALNNKVGANDGILLKLKDLCQSLADSNHIIKSNLLNMLLSRTTHNPDIQNMVMLAILNDEETSSLNADKLARFFDEEDFLDLDFESDLKTIQSGSSHSHTPSNLDPDFLPTGNEMGAARTPCYMLFSKYLKLTKIENSLKGKPIIQKIIPRDDPSQMFQSLELADSCDLGNSLNINDYLNNFSESAENFRHGERINLHKLNQNLAQNDFCEINLDSEINSESGKQKEGTGLDGAGLTNNNAGDHQNILHKFKDTLDEFNERANLNFHQNRVFHQVKVGWFLEKSEFFYEVHFSYILFCVINRC